MTNGVSICRWLWVESKMNELFLPANSTGFGVGTVEPFDNSNNRHGSLILMVIFRSLSLLFYGPVDDAFAWVFFSFLLCLNNEMNSYFYYGLGWVLGHDQRNTILLHFFFHPLRSPLSKIDRQIDMQTKSFATKRFGRCNAYCLLHFPCCIFA